MELEKSNRIVDELRDEQERIIEAMYGSNFDDDTIAKAKALCAQDQATNPSADLSQRHVIWEILVIDLLRILTKEVDKSAS